MPGTIKTAKFKIDQNYTHFCERCGEKLNPKKMVWLELDQRTNTYTDGYVSEEVSQGGFTFGRACSVKMLMEHEKAARKRRSK